MFDIGVESLIEQLPKVFTGEAGEIAKDQGEEGLSHADKVSSEEGDLDFSALSALEAHNKVRAFDGWPGDESDVYHSRTRRKVESRKRLSRKYSRRKLAVA